MPGDERFRIVLETAVRIYLRPICGSAGPIPEVTRTLLEMVAEITGAEPIEVVLACRLPELEISVASGGRRTARTFKV